MSLIKHLKAFSFALIIAAICLIVQLFAPDSVLILRYEKLAVNQGEWWRIFTANFTHSGWNHLFLNLSGLLIIDYLFQPLVKMRTRAQLLLFCMVANVSFLHLFHDLLWYVGLSGALHGYLVGGAILSFKQTPIMSGLTVLVVAIKLFAELTFDINEQTSVFIGANVVEEAHLYGTISAVIYCGALYLYKLFLRR